MPDISVIIPVFNSSEYFRGCIDSVLLACRKSEVLCEIILIDDGSSDECSDLCDQYALSGTVKTDIIVIHQKNVGQATARNRGVELTISEWVTFVDSDDYVHPKYIQELYELVNKYNAGISMVGAVFDAGTVPEKFGELQAGETTVYDVNEGFFEGLYKGAWHENAYKNEVVWGKMIPRNIIVTLPFTEGRFCEDAAIMCYWFQASRKVADSCNRLYFYRDNLLGTMNSFDEKKREDRLWSILQMRNFCVENNYGVLRERFEKAFLWQILEFERSFPEHKEYRKVRKRKCLPWILKWNLSTKQTLGSLKEYYIR